LHRPLAAKIRFLRRFHRHKHANGGGILDGPPVTKHEFRVGRHGPPVTKIESTVQQVGSTVTKNELSMQLHGSPVTNNGLLVQLHGSAVAESRLRVQSQGSARDMLSTAALPPSLSTNQARARIVG
jgi:hypothetical protein